MVTESISNYSNSESKTLTRRLVANKYTRIAAAALVLAGCGEEEKPFESGTLIEKRYEEAEEWFQLLPIPYRICSGSPPVCTTHYNYVPIFHHDDEDWVMRIEDCKTSSEGQRTCRTKEFYVNNEIFNASEVGDYVDFGSEMQGVSTSDPILKTQQ